MRSSGTSCTRVNLRGTFLCLREAIRRNWGRFRPEHTTAVSLLDRLLHHANVVVTDGESHRMRQARTRQTGGANQR